MQEPAWRVELELLPEHSDPLGDEAARRLRQAGCPVAGRIRFLKGWLLPASLRLEEVERIARELLADPVVETWRILGPGQVPEDGERLLVVRRHAGVADPEAASARRALALLDITLPEGAWLESYRAWRLEGEAPDAEALLGAGGRALANPTIEDALPGSRVLALRRFEERPPAPGPQRVEVPVLERDPEALERLSREHGLALSREEMLAIQKHFRRLGREPSDVELETLAQTWSEHCKHKTLTGPVRLRVLDDRGGLKRERLFQNLLKETVFAATERLSPPWCWSVFRDNAGVVELTPETGIAVKVETHNHPSALEPYGGAGTGIGGVIRDILGTGRGARPFANLDVFCVGPAGLEAGDLPPGTLSPDRILEGVVAGVRDYGNRMGIPTVCGTVLRHPGYVANPLVFAGCVGEIPRACVDKEVHPGDVIVALGGRTGRDGIHGATFSSEALHEESESADSTAVQIGDPITEKKLLDVLLQARDRRLYRAVTDCGAGGFSSAVGEMGEETGAEVDLETVPLKYPGLSYAEVWISEAQERMVLAVPPERLQELLELCRAEEVEAVAIGRFTGDRRLVLRWHGEVVGELGMDFLHGGVPQPERPAEVVERDLPATPWPEPEEAPPGPLLHRVLEHPAVASKEWVVRQYDHEVQGGTLLKPYQGPEQCAPGDGAVLRPDPRRPEAVVLGCGLAPAVGLLDPWAGAACAIDEAVRNVVAAGGDPHRLALLDNFCWGDCRKPDRLGALVRAAEACYEAALAFGAPFISGKDSLNNEYRSGDREIPIPPTLLATAVAPLADGERAVPAFLQEAGDLLAVVGLTRPEGGASVASELLGLGDSRPPRPDLERAPSLVAALHAAQEAGLVRACHDLSEGGLAAAAAEMGFGTGLGAELDLAPLPAAGRLPVLAALFSETPTRFLVEIAPADLEAFERHLRGQPWAVLGRVLPEPLLRILDQGRDLLEEEVAALARSNGAAAPPPVPA